MQRMIPTMTSQLLALLRRDKLSGEGCVVTSQNHVLTLRICLSPEKRIWNLGFWSPRKLWGPDCSLRVCMCSV